MKISEIKENPNNPRKITKDHLEKLVKSIKDDPEMMELRPIVYDPETMEVLGGNQRLAALKKAGYKEIPDGWAVPASKLTEEQKKRFILKDNANLGEWDFEVLSVEFEDFDLESLGIKFEKVQHQEAIQETKEIDVGSFDFDHRCPKCGFEFND